MYHNLRYEHRSWIARTALLGQDRCEVKNGTGKRTRGRDGKHRDDRYEMLVEHRGPAILEVYTAQRVDEEGSVQDVDQKGNGQGDAEYHERSRGEGDQKDNRQKEKVSEAAPERTPVDEVAHPV